MEKVVTTPGVLRPRFVVGTRVKVDARGSLGHCRTPVYVRGKVGEVVGIHGVYRDPERLGYHKPGYPALVLYKVRFQQRELWPDYRGPVTDQLEVDIYENWLSTAPMSQRKTARGAPRDA